MEVLSDGLRLKLCKPMKRQLGNIVSGVYELVPAKSAVGRLGERVAAQVRQVNQALREDPVLLHPAERRNEIGSSATLGRQLDGFRRAELFHALYPR